jgi:hypothetical protein
MTGVLKLLLSCATAALSLFATSITHVLLITIKSCAFVLGHNNGVALPGCALLFNCSAASKGLHVLPLLPCAQQATGP